MTDTKYERILLDKEQNEENEFDCEAKVTTEIPKFGPNQKMGILQTAVATMALILFYFTLSIGLTFYQSSLLQKFPFPLCVVLYHLIIKLAMASIVRGIYRAVTGRPRVSLDFKSSLKIAPTGIASGIDIGFSNWGLELVQISLYTMTKSTTIIFILIFAIMLGLEKKSWSLAIIVILISGGLFMFTYKSTHFDALGFSFLLIASLSSGIRWSFAQLVMQKSKLGLHNPIDMMYHMQPWMILAILPVTIGFEGRKILNDWSSVATAPSSEIILMWLKVSIGAFIAFAMEFSEFLVLSFTSSLTLSVAGIFKEICQLVLAVETKGDQLSFMNIIGLIMCLGGICSHVVHKYWIYTTERPEGLVTFEKTRTSNSPVMNITDNKYRTGQQMPLLDSDEYENSDSDNSHNENLNSSEVIFDVLKRRDTRR